jgi:hypothetical protein
MTVAAVLFAIAALGGVVIAVMRFRGKELPPMGLALLHGLIAAAGLVALILVAVGGNVSTQAAIALVGFVIAALGGFLLFSFHLRLHALPKPLVVIHGLVAVVSFMVLIFAIIAVRT